jgi:hypothetical protein
MFFDLQVSLTGSVRALPSIVLRCMTGFLLDTNVPSELTRLRPEARVVHWLDAQNNERLFLSVVTPGEIRKGVTLLVDISGAVNWRNGLSRSSFRGLRKGYCP